MAVWPIARTSVAVLAGLAAGFAIAIWLEPSPRERTAATPSTPSATAERSESAEPSRLDDLEVALRAEVEERAALEARVLELAQALERLQTARDSSIANGDAPGVDSQAGEQAGQRLLRAAPDLREDVRRAQVELLMAAGFAPDRAEWITRRASELRMQTLQAQYAATREGREFNPAADLGGDRTLRDELGDVDYERYLAALGRPTSVGVLDVLASSPAERAGLRPGDEIVAYAGTRVFDMRDLNALTLEGTPAEPVTVDVLRDGVRVQLVLPRGPVGILSGRRGRVRP